MQTYRVQLDDYCGPLDLLLYLVRRNEVDVVRMPIARIARQFVEFLDVLQLLDFDFIGDFVVTASTLMEIKSRLVLPQPEAELADETPLDDGLRSELIARLLEYKQYKEAALDLDQRAAAWQQRYPRLSDDRPAIGRDHAADPIREVELWDLVSALSRVLQKKVVEHTSSIRYDETPQSAYMERIASVVRESGRIPFSTFFEGASQRSRIIGIFLAILELLRHHGFRAEQPVAYGEIFVLPPIDELRPSVTASLN